MGHIIDKHLSLAGDILQLFHLLLNRLGHGVEVGGQFPDFILRLNFYGVIFSVGHLHGGLPQPVDPAGQQL